MDPSEFLWSIRNEPRFDGNFRSTPGPVAYHAPCHLRAQGVGFKGRDLLRRQSGARPLRHLSRLRIPAQPGTAQTPQGMGPRRHRIDGPAFRHDTRSPARQTEQNPAQNGGDDVIATVGADQKC